MSEVLTFALVGCGTIGTKHAALIHQLGILQAVCDIEKDKATHFAQQYSCRAYVELEDLLAQEKNIDVVVVCTPNGLHAKHTIKSLEAGCHVLCEKPMAINIEDAQQMITVAEKTSKKLFVVKQNRFNPPVAAVKKLIDEGRLGKIFNVQLNCFWNRNNDYYNNNWRGTKALDGGILFTQFSHFIDLLFWMIGDVSEVKSFKNNFLHKTSIELEDTGVVIIKFQNGAIGTINYTVNSFEKNMEGSLTLFGEKGTVKIGGAYLNTLEYQCIENYVIEDLPQGNTQNQYATYQGSMSNHDKVYKNLIDVLNNNSTMTANAFDGLKTVEMISKIYSC